MGSRAWSLSSVHWQRGAWVCSAYRSGPELGWMSADFTLTTPVISMSGMTEGNCCVFPVCGSGDGV
jgi:hypothetical protein